MDSMVFVCEPVSLFLTYSKKLNILKLEDLHLSELAKFHFMNTTNALPTPFLDMYKRNSDVHSYNTRQQDNVHFDKFKCDLVFRSFICRSPNLWSKLPSFIKEAKSIHSFGSRIKKHLFHNYWSAKENTLFFNTYLVAYWFQVRL